MFKVFSRRLYLSSRYATAAFEFLKQQNLNFLPLPQPHGAYILICIRDDGAFRIFGS